ncbi:MAG TPA: hypothetical protein VIJ75_08650 [Hanamia sp.]
MKRILIILTTATFLFGCKKQSGNEIPQTNPTPKVDTSTAVMIDASMIQQTIYGFGGADIIDWTGDLTTGQRDTAFSPTNGIGLSIVRVRVPVDPAEFGQAKATIDACKSYGGFAIASVWSAPASMKTNDSNIGGTIKPTSYADFAAYMRAFNAASGGLADISPTNEPNISVTYESMQMTASQVADFVAAEGDSCGSPIMAPEPFNMDQTYLNTYLSNDSAKLKTSFIAGHIYGATPYTLSVDKPVWMTEHYINSNLSGDDWSNAMNAGKEINDCMSAGWGAYVWWYIRRGYGPISESGNIQKLGYVMAQYARYIRPGFTKISCTEKPSTGIYVTAYSSGSKIVIVAINQNSSEVYLPFNLNGASVSGFTKYTSTSSSNLVSGSVSISGSTFGTVLPVMSITTLVSN